MTGADDQEPETIHVNDNLKIVLQECDKGTRAMAFDEYGIKIGHKKPCKHPSCLAHWIVNIVKEQTVIACFEKRYDQ